MAGQVTDERTSLTLKVSFGGEYRRVRCWPGDTVEATAELARASVCDLYSLSGDVSLTYRGESGACTLTEGTLSDALRLAAPSGILHLTASTVKPRSQPSSDAPPRASAAVDPSQAVPVSPEHIVDAPQFVTDSAEALQSAERSQTCQGEPSISPGRPLSISERWRSVRPRIQEGFSRLKQEVSNDYQVNCEDMKNAFGAARSGASDPLVPERASNAQAVAGTIAGVLAAGRMIPVRCTKLVAQSVAGVATTSEPTHQDDQGARESSVNTPDAVDTQNGDPESSEGDLSHFKNQIAQDFQNTRQAVQSALADLTGYEATSPSSSRTAEVLPAVVSTIAGLKVAADMLPLRAARLAVAKVSS